MTVAVKKTKTPSIAPAAVPAPTPVATEPTLNYVDQIGETAGAIWHILNEQGRQTLARLQQIVDAQPNMVMHAIGWLAREGKIELVENGRSRYVALK